MSSRKAKFIFQGQEIGTHFEFRLDTSNPKISISRAIYAWVTIMPGSMQDLRASRDMYNPDDSSKGNVYFPMVPLYKLQPFPQEHNNQELAKSHCILLPLKISSLD